MPGAHHRHVHLPGLPPAAEARVARCGDPEGRDSLGIRGRRRADGGLGSGGVAWRISCLPPGARPPPTPPRRWRDEWDWPRKQGTFGRHLPRGVLLDVDGTLVDSNDAHAHAWVDALARARHRRALRARAAADRHGRRQAAARGDAASTRRRAEGRRSRERRSAIFRERYLPRAAAASRRARELLRAHAATRAHARRRDLGAGGGAATRCCEHRRRRATSSTTRRPRRRRRALEARPGHRRTRRCERAGAARRTRRA